MDGDTHSLREAYDHAVAERDSWVEYVRYAASDDADYIKAQAYLDGLNLTIDQLKVHLR